MSSQSGRATDEAEVVAASARLPYVWVLNPDAERELAATLSYAVRAAFVARIESLRPRFEKLVCGEPALFSHEPALDLAGLGLSLGAAAPAALLWCPTKHARLAAQRFGLRLPAAPSMDVLRRVHNKRFLSEALAGLTLPGRTLIASELEWQHLRSSTRGPLRLKRPYAYAGKGQRIWPEQGSRDDLRWLGDSLRQGGFIAEPNVEASQELSLHGFVDAAGCELGQPCLLQTDPRGIPLDVSAAPVAQLQVPLSQLTEFGRSAANALLAAKYFGPFGLDILVVDGRPHIIDLNPRFTLGWSVGLGEQRTRVLQRALAPSPA